LRKEAERRWVGREELHFYLKFWKRRYFVPVERRVEFYGEIAKAVYRWKNPEPETFPQQISDERVPARYTREPLKIVEMSPRDQPYKLLFDLDIKMKTDKISELEMLDLFLGKIFELVKSQFPVPEDFVVGKNTIDSVVPGLPNFYDFSITGTLDRFTWFQENPDIKWKYGFHILFPNIHVTSEIHLQFFQLLISKFEEFQSSGAFNQNPESSEIFKEITECNTWPELFDMSTFDPSELELRMLYTYVCLYFFFSVNISPSRTREEAIMRGETNQFYISLFLFFNFF
jgi:hypothetical protein